MGSKKGEREPEVQSWESGRKINAKKSMMNKTSKFEIKTSLVLVDFPVASGFLLAGHSSVQGNTHRQQLLPVGVTRSSRGFIPVSVSENKRAPD